MEKSYMPRLDDFVLELNDLKTAKDRDYINDSFILKGLIKSFEMCFDLSWKVMKDIIRYYYGSVDYSLGSPAENIRKAYQVGLIGDDEKWLKLLRVRNKIVHDYDGRYALMIAEDIVNEYTCFFDEFGKKMISFADEHEEEMKRSMENDS